MLAIALQSFYGGRSIAAPVPQSSHPSQFLTNHATQYRLQRLLRALHEIAERLIHQSLVAASARGVNALPKPLHNVVVEPDRNPSLAGRNRQHRSPFSLTVVVFLFHELSSYS